MRYLFNYWNQLCQRLQDRPISLFLDYDGTLVPIAKTPQQAVIGQAARSLLFSLTQIPGYKLAIISGRSAQEVKKIVGLSKITYVGNHGLEIKGPGLNYEFPLPQGYKKLIKQINSKLIANLKNIKGAIVMFKGLTLSLHYRMVENKDLPLLEDRYKQLTWPYILQKEIKGFNGKKVFEIIPPVDWNKGSASLWLLKSKKFAGGKKNFLPIYIGDDTTDEDAFRVLRRRGLTIVVGKRRNSGAEYYLRNTREVLGFLRRLLCES